MKVGSTSTCGIGQSALNMANCPERLQINRTLKWPKTQPINPNGSNEKRKRLHRKRGNVLKCCLKY